MGFLHSVLSVVLAVILSVMLAVVLAVILAVVLAVMLRVLLPRLPSPHTIYSVSAYFKPRCCRSRSMPPPQHRWDVRTKGKRSPLLLLPQIICTLLQHRQRVVRGQRCPQR